MTMAGKGPEVLVTHTKDLGQIIQGVHIAAGTIGGYIDVQTAIAVAQLALKHRENKNLRQRIIVFVASPLDGPGADEQSMVKLAKKLKKNNVAVDIISYGDGIEQADADGKTVLKSFVDNVTSSDNSHLLTVSPGTNLLSDALISSPILSADRSASIPEELGGTGSAAIAAAGPSTSNNFEFGVDPSLDPELAMALRMSMQEAQAREAAEAAVSSTPAAAATTDSSVAATTTTTTTVAAAAAASTTSAPADPADPEENRLLQEAMAMSTQDEDVDMEYEEEEEDEEDEDAAIARAIEMSMRGQDDDDKAAKKK
jgi:26S proteasome regulatory subunit N10